MEAIETLRKADRRNAARGLGEDYRQPRVMASQQKAARHASDILALPTDPGDWVSAQDVTVGSSTFGASYFRPDYHLPDDPNHPIR